MTLSKYAMASKLKDKLGCSHAYATSVIEFFSDVLIEELLQGNAVNLNRIGKLCLLKRKSRVGTNPQTIEKIIIPETTVIKLKNYSSIKQILNNK